MRSDCKIYEAFADAAMVNRLHDPWYKRKVNGGEYGNFVITHSDGFEWYKDFVGVEFFGRIIYDDYRIESKRVIKEVYVVKLVKNHMHEGRSINGKHIDLI